MEIAIAEFTGVTAFWGFIALACEMQRTGSTFCQTGRSHISDIGVLLQGD
jgi:hypothetical protein